MTKRISLIFLSVIFVFSALMFTLFYNNNVAKADDPVVISLDEANTSFGAQGMEGNRWLAYTKYFVGGSAGSSYVDLGKVTAYKGGMDEVTLTFGDAGSFGIFHVINNGWESGTWPSATYFLIKAGTVTSTNYKVNEDWIFAVNGTKATLKIAKAVALNEAGCSYTPQGNDGNRFFTTNSFKVVGSADPAFHVSLDGVTAYKDGTEKVALHVREYTSTQSLFYPKDNGFAAGEWPNALWTIRKGTLLNDTYILNESVILNMAGTKMSLVKTIDDPSEIFGSNYEASGSEKYFGNKIATTDRWIVLEWTNDASSVVEGGGAYRAFYALSTSSSTRTQYGIAGGDYNNVSPFYAILANASSKGKAIKVSIDTDNGIFYYSIDGGENAVLYTIANYSKPTGSLYAKIQIHAGAVDAKLNGLKAYSVSESGILTDLGIDTNFTDVGQFESVIGVDSSDVTGTKKISNESNSFYIGSYNATSDPWVVLEWTNGEGNDIDLKAGHGFSFIIGDNNVQMGYANNPQARAIFTEYPGANVKLYFNMYTGKAYYSVNNSLVSLLCEFSNYNRPSSPVTVRLNYVQYVNKVTITGFKAYSVDNNSKVTDLTADTDLVNGELSIDYCNLAFEDNIYILYAVNGVGVAQKEDIKVLIWNSPKDEYLYGTENTVLDFDSYQNIGGKDYAMFIYDKLAAKQMGDYVYARAYYNGEYSSVNKYSILQYAYNKVNTTSNENLKQLLVDMLNYGASAQKYFGYKTSDPVNQTYYKVDVVNGTLPDGFTFGLCAKDSEVTLTASDIDGKTFSYWKNSKGQTVGTTKNITVTVTANETWTAVFTDGGKGLYQANKVIGQGTVANKENNTEVLFGNVKKSFSTVKSFASGVQLSIDYCNLAFEDSIYILYAVDSTGVSNKEDIKVLVWNSPKDSYTYGTQSATLEFYDYQKIGGKDYAMFIYDKLAAKQMGDYVYARAYYNGNYSGVNKYSILQYAYNKINGTANDDLKQLLVDMLNYGASAQKYFEYKADTPVNKATYKINVVNGSLSDGFITGLYTENSTIELRVNSIPAGKSFYCWKNSNNETVSTESNAKITAVKDETYTAEFVDGISYKTEYYKQESLGGKYVLSDTAYKSGVTGNEVTAEIKNYDGYTYNEAKSSITGVVKADGSLVLSVYYDKLPNDGLTWTTYNFPSTTITTSTNRTVSLNNMYISGKNKFKLVYSLDQPVKAFLTIGSHEEDFYLEAGENMIFTSFMDDVIGDFTEMKRLEVNRIDSVTNGKTWSGYVGLSFEPIQNVTVTFKPQSFSVAYQSLPNVLVTVENDRFKMGTHLYYAGALSYFEDLTDGRSDIGNLVNANDGGRLIQQSYYGDDLGSNNNQVYNPVQGGNGYGFSKLIDLVVDGNTLYAKTRAKCWLSQDRYTLSESYMENWYTVYDDYAIVKNTFVDFVDSNNVSNAGECPAVYWVGGLDTLYVYEGTKSWTGDKLSRYEGGDGVSLALGAGGSSGNGHGHAWIDCTETWSAWVNDAGWGAGVYTPGVVDFTSWQADYSAGLEYGIYNPYRGYTSYIGPHINFTIRPFEKWEYSYMMTTGSVDEIRALFTENKDFVVNEYPERYKDTYDLTDIDFTNEKTLKFITRPNNTDTNYEDQRKVTRVTTTGTFDPYFGIGISNDNNVINVEDYRYISVEYMIPERCSYLNNCDMGFFFGVGTNEWVSGHHALGFKAKADGKWHIGYVDLQDLITSINNARKTNPDIPAFTGRINIIRFDFIDSVVTKINDEYFLKHLRFTNELPVDNSYEDPYVPTARTWVNKANAYGSFNFSRDSFSTADENLIKASGWILYKNPIARFEFLQLDSNIASETLAKSATYEGKWQHINRTVTRSRFDASSGTKTGDDGSSAHFNIQFAKAGIEAGKNKTVYVRAVAYNGDAMMLWNFDINIPKARDWVPSGNAPGCFASSVDSTSLSGGTRTYNGWVLCYTTIDHFEHFIYEKGEYEDSYRLTGYAEDKWTSTGITRTVASYRPDPVAAYPKIGDDGSTCRMGLSQDLSGLQSGKTYKICIRAITIDGKACSIYFGDYTA